MTSTRHICLRCIRSSSPESPALKLPVMHKMVPDLLICQRCRQVAALRAVQVVVEAEVAAQLHGDCPAKPEAHSLCGVYIYICSSFGHL